MMVIIHTGVYIFVLSVLEGVKGLGENLKTTNIGKGEKDGMP